MMDLLTGELWTVDYRGGRIHRAADTIVSRAVTMPPLPAGIEDERTVALINWNGTHGQIARDDPDGPDGQAAVIEPFDDPAWIEPFIEAFNAAGE